METFLSHHKKVYITGEIGGKTVVYATVKDTKSILSCSCRPCRPEVFIHDPPMDIDHVTTDGLTPTFWVDKPGKDYVFMMGNRRVAQIMRKWMTEKAKNEGYFVEIGPNMDVAFMCMCAMAIDQLYMKVQASSAY
eukprot:TRINITY_DN3267_c0_g1_i4.p1 TRINITY_DN3267_c0_g1~~TRINITY_DN3267_c0_g1_i4.p1  ORF type:complete len:135 (+),score=21.76 TRINITY_DN3267_c0_g1_i4:482-886(+)